MTSARMRASLFLLGLCILGAIAGLQLVWSVPYAAMTYMIGVGLIIMLLEPFLGLLIYLAIWYVRPHVLIPGFDEFPLMLVIGGAAFASMLIHGALGRGRATVFKSPQTYLLLWILLAIVMSHLTNGRIDDAASAGFGFMHAAVAYLLIASLVTSVKRLEVVMLCLAGLTIWVAVQGLIVHYTGVGLGGIEPVEGDRIRVLGFSNDPNTLAGGLLLMFPFFYLESVRGGNAVRRITAAAALLLVCYVVFLTRSRGGAITLATIASLLLVRTFGWIRGALLAGLAVLAVYLLGPARFKELNMSEPSAFGRLLAWERALGEFQGRPLFGIGSERSGAGTELVPHSGFMQAAAELGVFGLFPWVALIFVSLRNASFAAKRAASKGFERLSVLTEASFLGCLAWTVALLFVGSPFYDQLYMFAALCAASVAILCRASDDQYRMIEKRDYVYSLMLILGSLAAHGLVLHIAGL